MPEGTAELRCFVVYICTTGYVWMDFQGISGFNLCGVNLVQNSEKEESFGVVISLSEGFFYSASIGCHPGRSFDSHANPLAFRREDFLRLYQVLILNSE